MLNPTWLHVEPTTRCNAWCPSCLRNNNGFGLRDLVVEDLNLDRFREVLNQHNFNTIQMCGVLGDPCAAKNIDEQFEIIKQTKSIKRLQIHTNGSLRKMEWWASLPKFFEHLEQFDIFFAIDGLKGSHEIYRQGTNWDKVIENAKAFINAGGSAIWQFIPFKHNEKEITKCMKMSQDLKFTRFEFVKNAKYEEKNYHYQTGKEIIIKPWGYNQRFNKLLGQKTEVKLENCFHLSKPSLFLSASGNLTPCCYYRNLTKFNIKTDFDNKTWTSTCLKSCGN